LRAPKSLQGTMQTNAAALLLPGGGFGGNWRGQGFVSLPAPTSLPLAHSSINFNSPVHATPDSGPAQLTYSYPSIALTSDVSRSLYNESLLILDSAEQLKSTITNLASTPFQSSEALAKESSNSSSIKSRPSISDFSPSFSSILTRSSVTLSKVSNFLARVEEIDIASHIDIEPPAPTRRGSQESPTLGSIDRFEPVEMDYRKSVHQARPLLSELEGAKQSLYDISASFMMAVQDVYLINGQSTITSSASTSTRLTSITHNKTTSMSTQPETILNVIDELKSAISSLCKTMTALGDIADVQASSPAHAARNVGMSLRITTANQGTSSPMTASSSHSSQPTASDELHVQGTITPRRGSVDSDFFFPSTATGNSTSLLPSPISPPTTPLSTTSKLRGSKTSQLFSQMPGWERRESNATVASSVQSDGMPFRRGYNDVDTRAFYSHLLSVGRSEIG
jgi:hypothetical protein